MVLARPGAPGRGLVSLLPLGVAFESLSAAAFAFLATARGSLEASAPGRRWLVTACVLLCLAAASHHQRWEVRQTLGDALALSTDGRVIAAAWVTDAAQVAAWGAVARWATRRVPPV